MWVFVTEGRRLKVVRLDMNPVTSLKIIVFPSLEEKTIADRRSFCPASSIFPKPTKQMTGLEGQAKNGEWSETGKLGERKSLENRRQFSCPTIIDFNSLKSYQEIRPVHKPKRIFNGFFPSRVKSTITGLPNYRKEKQETLEELVPNPNTLPYQDSVVLSRSTTSRNSLRSEPNAFPNESEPRPIKPDPRRVSVYSLRNGSPSPWIDRYKLKQKSISVSSVMDLRNRTEDPQVRGFSR